MGCVSDVDKASSGLVGCISDVDKASSGLVGCVSDIDKSSSGFGWCIFDKHACMLESTAAGAVPERTPTKQAAPWLRRACTRSVARMIRRWSCLLMRGAVGEMSLGEGLVCVCIVVVYMYM